MSKKPKIAKCDREKVAIVENMVTRFARQHIEFHFLQPKVPWQDLSRRIVNRMKKELRKV